MPPRPYPLLLAACLAGCAHAAPEPPAEAAPAPPAGVVAPAPEVLRAIGVATAPVARRRLPLQLEVLGQVAARPEAEAVVHAPIAGHVVAVRAALGDRVARGAPLAEIRSTELGRAQAAYLEALGLDRLAGREHDRQRRLFAGALASRRELEEAEQRHAAARVKLAQATEDLRVLGHADADLAAIARRGRVDPRQVVRAPAAGTIVARDATLGDRVAPEDAEPLFRLADLATVRVEAAVPERDLPAVQAGQPVVVTLDALGGRALPGRVARLAPMLDGASHAGRAMIDVANPAGALRPGMSARIRVEVGAREVLALPAMAVQREGDRAFVYVARAEGGFRETPVVLGARSGDAYAVGSGLAAGDRVVVRGAFDLRAEARKAAFGGE